MIINFLQVEDAVVAQKSHAAAKLNKLMNDFNSVKNEQQHETMKKIIQSARFGTYQNKTVADLFEVFQVKDSWIAKQIKADFLRFMKEVM